MSKARQPGGLVLIEQQALDLPARHQGDHLHRVLRRDDSNKRVSGACLGQQGRAAVARHRIAEPLRLVDGNHDGPIRTGFGRDALFHRHKRGELRQQAKAHAQIGDRLLEIGAQVARLEPGHVEHHQILDLGARPEGGQRLMRPRACPKAGGRYAAGRRPARCCPSTRPRPPSLPSGCRGSGSVCH